MYATMTHSTQHDQLQDVQTEEREMLEAKSLPLQNYLMRHVMPTLTQGLIEVCKTKPQDPVDYLVCDNTHGCHCWSVYPFCPPIYRLSSSSRTIHRLTDILTVFILLIVVHPTSNIMCACAHVQLLSNMSEFSEESSAPESDVEEKNLPEGAPRISSGALLELEGGGEEELR